MGLSSSKSSTKPIYGTQITGAADTLNNAYNATAPKITAVTDAIGGLVPSLISKYTNGDPGVNAATAYNTDVLNGKYLNGSPQLDAMVTQTNNDARNGVEAALGTRGLTGGSDYTGLVAKALAENETGLRYTDYNNERGRQSTAAGLAPSLAAASYLPIQSLIDAAQAQAIPLTAAATNASGTGSLLGSYVKNKQSQSTGSILGGIIGSGLAGWASGGFKGV